jgi:hypothetical protein
MVHSPKAEGGSGGASKRIRVQTYLCINNVSLVVKEKEHARADALMTCLGLEGNKH